MWLAFGVGWPRRRVRLPVGLALFAFGVVTCGALLGGGVRVLVSVEQTQLGRTCVFEYKITTEIISKLYFLLVFILYYAWFRVSSTYIIVDKFQVIFLTVSSHLISFRSILCFSCPD